MLYYVKQICKSVYFWLIVKYLIMYKYVPILDHTRTHIYILLIYPNYAIVMLYTYIQWEY